MTMDVYFDYACPFCLRGFAYLQELSKKYPDIELNFIPVEAHPRPETFGLHTDLCAQGMYAALDMGVPIWDYHTATFKAAINDRINIESAGVLSEALAYLLDKKQFFETLQSNRYQDQINQNNHRAYNEEAVWAVPSFRTSDGRKLDSEEGKGITFQQLEDLMKGSTI